MPMQCRLRTYDANPPGGYFFVQTEGIKQNFQTLPTIESQAQAVSAFRLGNKLPRASIQECILDIDHFTAARLGCNRMWTVPIDSPAGSQATSLPANHPILAPCQGCGATILT